jgi:hypothetical protein
MHDPQPLTGWRVALYRKPCRRSTRSHAEHGDRPHSTARLYCLAEGTSRRYGIRVTGDVAFSSPRIPSDVHSGDCGFRTPANPRKCPVPFSHTPGGTGNFLSRSDHGALSHRPPEVRGLRLTAHPFLSGAARARAVIGRESRKIDRRVGRLPSRETNKDLAEGTLILAPTCPAR